MSESSSIKLIRRLNPYDYSSIIIPIRFKTSFQLLYLLVSLNIIFFLIIYHRLILIKPPFSKTKHLPNNVDNDHEQSLSICYIPPLDPWDQTIAKSLRIKPIYRCSTNRKNLINVINSSQLFINDIVNKTYYSNSITHCVYFKINRNPEEKYFRDWSYSLSEPILIRNGRTDPILDADFVLTRCYKDRRGFFHNEKFW
jgi:hypothetical protein